MKAYVTTTGALFALLVMIHIWRAVVEGSTLFKDPFYILATLAAAALAVWAWRVRATIPAGK